MFVTNFKLKSAVQRFLCEAREIIDFAGHHPTREMRHIALRETVEYIKANMLNAIGVYTSRQVLDIGLQSAKVNGHFLEFGVYRGGTISYIARMRPDVTIHGFDSFEGLPDKWRGYILDKGAFDLRGKLPRVPRNVRLHRGWFDETLPKWTIANQGPVSFIHIDCDLYSSTKTVFEHLSPRIVEGTVIVFDEYFGYPNWEQHEIKAFKELVVDRKLSYEYLAYAKTQVALKISQAGPKLTDENS